MRTITEYVMLLALGSATALTACFLFGAYKRAVAAVLLNSLLGAATAFIPTAFGVYLPAWAFFLCGALGAGGAFLYLL